MNGAYILKINGIPTTRLQEIEDMIYKWQDMPDAERPTQVTLEISRLRWALKGEKSAKSNLRVLDQAI
jgi:hypothetical protein